MHGGGGGRWIGAAGGREAALLFSARSLGESKPYRAERGLVSE